MSSGGKTPCHNHLSHHARRPLLFLGVLESLSGGREVEMQNSCSVQLFRFYRLANGAQKNAFACFFFPCFFVIFTSQNDRIFIPNHQIPNVQKNKVNRRLFLAIISCCGKSHFNIVLRIISGRVTDFLKYQKMHREELELVYSRVFVCVCVCLEWKAQPKYLFRGRSQRGSSREGFTIQCFWVS